MVTSPGLINALFFLFGFIAGGTLMAWLHSIQIAAIDRAIKEARNRASQEFTNTVACPKPGTNREGETEEKH